MNSNSILHYTTPMMQLQDSKQTQVLIVTPAETTPVLLRADNLKAISPKSNAPRH